MYAHTVHMKVCTYVHIRIYVYLTLSYICTCVLVHACLGEIHPYVQLKVPSTCVFVF